MNIITNTNMSGVRLFGKDDVQPQCHTLGTIAKLRFLFITKHDETSCWNDNMFKECIAYSVAVIMRAND